MAMMLLNANATVTICHSRTKNLADVVSRAEILVGAVGKPEFIKADWIRDGAVVVDAGYHPGGVGDIEIAQSSSALCLHARSRRSRSHDHRHAYRPDRRSR